MIRLSKFFRCLPAIVMLGQPSFADEADDLKRQLDDARSQWSQSVENTAQMDQEIDFRTRSAGAIDSFIAIQSEITKEYIAALKEFNQQSSETARLFEQENKDIQQGEAFVLEAIRSIRSQDYAKSDLDRLWAEFKTLDRSLDACYRSKAMRGYQAMAKFIDERLATLVESYKEARLKLKLPAGFEDFLGEVQRKEDSMNQAVTKARVQLQAIITPETKRDRCASMLGFGRYLNAAEVLIHTKQAVADLRDIQLDAIIASIDDEAAAGAYRSVVRRSLAAQEYQLRTLIGSYKVHEAEALYKKFPDFRDVLLGNTRRPGVSSSLRAELQAEASEMTATMDRIYDAELKNLENMKDLIYGRANRFHNAYVKAKAKDFHNAQDWTDFSSFMSSSLGMSQEASLRLPEFSGREDMIIYSQNLATAEAILSRRGYAP